MSRPYRPAPFKGGRKTGMNKLEQRYADYLEIQRKAGQIEGYKYERVKLKLADNTFSRPLPTAALWKASSRTSRRRE